MQTSLQDSLYQNLFNYFLEIYQKLDTENQNLLDYKIGKISGAISKVIKDDLGMARKFEILFANLPR